MALRVAIIGSSSIGRLTWDVLNSLHDVEMAGVLSARGLTRDPRQLGGGRDAAGAGGALRAGGGAVPGSVADGPLTSPSAEGVCWR